MVEISPLIRTERLDLRDFRPEDFEAVHAYGSDPLVTRYTSWGPNTEEDTQNFLGFMAAEAAEQPRRNYTLAIVDRASGTLIGGCGVMSQRSIYREYETGYVLNRDWWGRGMVTEAMRGLLTFAFRDLGAHRIFARVFPENEASRRVVHRLGFQLEGHFRRDALKHGEWKDSLIFAILEDEWT
jgi:RimJ/RimL family protein N-acetyltransferase